MPAVPSGFPWPFGPFRRNPMAAFRLHGQPTENPLMASSETSCRIEIFYTLKEAQVLIKRKRH